MDDYESLSHTTWTCKYHVVFIPKCRRKVLYLELRRHLGEVLRKLALQKEAKVEEGHLMPDHVHMLLSIPPKYAVSQVVGYIKGKSAIHLARVYGERKRNFVGQHFWARGFFVNTVGRETQIATPAEPGGLPLTLERLTSSRQQGRACRSIPVAHSEVQKLFAVCFGMRQGKDHAVYN